MKPQNYTNMDATMCCLVKAIANITWQRQTSVEQLNGNSWRKTEENQRKFCPSAISCTINRTLRHLGLDLWLHSEKTSAYLPETCHDPPPSHCSPILNSKDIYYSSDNDNGGFQGFQMSTLWHDIKYKKWGGGSKMCTYQHTARRQILCPIWNQVWREVVTFHRLKLSVVL